MTTAIDLRGKDSHALIALLHQVRYDYISIPSKWRNTQSIEKYGQRYNPLLNNKRREIARILTILRERGITKEMAYAKVVA